MAIAITMKQAFDQALEEITNFHLDPQHDGFPRELTHHINRESPRRLSHGVDFVDHGNWAGSVLMYAMLFEVGPVLIIGGDIIIDKKCAKRGRKAAVKAAEVNTDLLICGDSAVVLTAAP